MKKSFLCLMLIILFVLPCKSIAKTQFAPVITQMEKSLFGTDYPTQSDEQRLQRIEEAVYGEKFSGKFSQRLNKISKDLNADLLGKEIKPKKDTFNEEEDYSYEPEEKADPSVNYPIVDELEKRAFDKTYKNMDISKRLANLENKVFKKAYNDDLNARTERLKVALLPKKKNHYDRYYSEDSIDLSDLYDEGKNNDFNEQLSQYPSFKNERSYGDSSVDIDVLSPLARLEKKILRKTFAEDEVSTRLVRLETKMFNTTFTQDDSQTRIDRISSAYQASKTSKKYDNNGVSQKMATAMQIGAFLLMILAVIL